MAQPRFPGTGGPSQRQLRVGETIRRALSEALTRGAVHDPELDRFSITVGEVRTSPDLKIATAFVLPLGGADREAALAALRRNRHELRRIVAQGLTLKFAPELRFALDETFDRMDAARALFQSDVVRRDVAAAQDDDSAAEQGRSDDGGGAGGGAGDAAGRDGDR